MLRRLTRSGIGFLRGVDRRLVKMYEARIDAIDDSLLTCAVGRYEWFRRRSFYALARRHRVPVIWGWQTLLAAFAETGTTLFDVGGNVGNVAHDAALLVGPTGRVVSFEPSAQEAVLRHRATVHSLTHLTVVKAAVGDAAGLVTLYEGDAFRGGQNSLRPLPQMATPVREVEVEMLTLDHWVVAHGIERVDVIKLDIEGAEVAALRGGLTMLTRDHPVVCIEIYEERLRAYGTSPVELCGFLLGLGYAVYHFDGNRIATINSSNAALPDRSDVIAVHPARHPAGPARLRSFEPHLRRSWQRS